MAVLLAMVLKGCFQLLGKLLWWAYFSVFPMFFTIAVAWVLHFANLPFILDSPWTMPGLLCFSAFVTGVMVGEKIAHEQGGMGMFLLGMLAQMSFAAMAWFDLRVSTIYSHYLPEVQETFIPMMVMALPAIGTMAMVFSRFFVLKED